MTDLDERIGQIARVPQLLIACDYDGTIAPIVSDPMQAGPRSDTVVAMRALAELPQTNVAVISGRALRDLATLSRLPHEIRLVGSHGSEFDVGTGADLPPRSLELRSQITTELRSLAEGAPGSFVERKPTGVAVHYRNVDVDRATELLAELDGVVEGLDDVFVKHGTFVVEFSVVEQNKGAALNEIRRQVNASAVLFIGDDLTDEDGFATLGGPDIGVKVGDSETIAEFSIVGTDEVARLLAKLSHHRRSWLMGSAAVPIESHSLLSDQRTAAIVTPDARITWMCVPRIDSGAVFAELVGGPAAGFFSVRPSEGDRPASQRYLKSTMVLESTWPQMTVVDYLDCSEGLPTEVAGRTDLIRVLSGSGKAVVEFAPRLDFGRVPTRIVQHVDGLEVVGAQEVLVLRSPGVDWVISEDGIHNTALAVIDLGPSDVVLEMRSGTSDLAERLTESERRVGTASFWSDWAGSLDIGERESSLVERSALLLKGLVQGPTGAVVAAATTSLPECIGGVRNWDYRYCWLRDAALSMSALVRLGSQEEAVAYLDWVLRVVDGRGDLERIAPLFNVSGRHLPPEAELADLPGYAGSRPVRVGNAADGQVQLDVFGPVVDLVHQLHVAGAPVSGEHWSLVKDMANAVVSRWRDPDHGIWEIRKPPRHHTHSKAMCWLTLDRAAKLAEHFDTSSGQRGQDTHRLVEQWRSEMDALVDEVSEFAYKAEIPAFTAAYDDADMDASVLAVGLTGMIDPRDERFVNTVEAVEALLRDGPTVYRYRSDDGLPGTEGGWHFMASWLIESYVLVGRTDDAETLFSQMCGLAGHTGLLSEEYDPATGQALGNVPQGYSHLGLINSALMLAGR